MSPKLLLALFGALALTMPPASAHVAPCTQGLPCSSDPCTPVSVADPVHLHGGGGQPCANAGFACSDAEAVCAAYGVAYTILRPFVVPFLPLCQTIDFLTVCIVEGSPEASG